MPILSDLIRSSSAAGELFAILESGSIAGVFGEIEFAAAREAFQRVATAEDKRGQVQTCIGHLNSSYSAFAHQLRTAGFLDRMLVSRNVQLMAAQEKAVFVLCVRAICHAYLAERTHCEEDLELAHAVLKENPLGTAGTLWAASSVINPVAAADVAYMAYKSTRTPGGEFNAYKVEEGTIDDLRARLLSAA